MNTVADHKQRQAALKPEQSFIVRAPAGSGKTELLIRRYLRLLAGVESPEEIIAITFTRKAAAEMRGRIIDALDFARDLIQSNETPADDYQKETFALAAEVLKRDEQQQWSLQDNPGRLRLLTIDALCSSITRQTPVLSQLGAQPETVDDASELYQQAAERTILDLESGEEWSDAVAELLSHLDNDLPRLKQLLADMLSRRDQWLRHVVNGNISREDLDQALHNIVTTELKRAQAAFTDSDEFIELLRYAAENLHEAGPEGEGKKSFITHCNKLSTLPEADSSALSQWHGIVEILLTQKDEWRKTVNKNTGFPTEVKGKTKEEVKALKERFMNLLESYSKNDALLEVLADIRYLPEVWVTNEQGSNSAWVNDTQWKILQALPKLLVIAEAHLRVLFSEQSKIDFTGIEQSALQALVDHVHDQAADMPAEQPSDLALQLDYKIQHILVDEFQDVSVSQYDLLERLTETWTGSDGRSLFLVGDPMQSIYRFREAEVGKFLSTFRNQHLGQVALESLTLEVNFRSQQGVVDWVNNSFSQILPQQEDIANSAVSYSSVIAADKSGEGKIQIHPLLQSDQIEKEVVAEQEAQKISGLIRDIQQEKTNKSIAILVRNRSHLSNIIEHLKKDDIPFQAVEIESLSHRAAIQDCMALTCALIHPADRIAWLSILRAPWCGLSLDDLHRLVGNDHRSTVWKLINDESKTKNLSEEGQARLNKLSNILNTAINNRRRKSLRRCVEMVWVQCGGPATLKEASDLENIQTFFDILQQAEEGSDLKTLSTLESSVEKLYAAAGVLSEEEQQENTQVQIMTIHKAKGLEFDVVILPGLGRGGRAEDKRLLLWQEQQTQEGGNDLLLAPIKETGEEDDKLYRYLEILEKAKLKNEEGRLLYVAATRAKEQLHLFGITKINDEKAIMNTPKKNSLLAKLWPIVETDYETAYENYKTQDNQQNETALSAQENENKISRHQSDWALPKAPENVNWQESDIETTSSTETEIEFEWASETIRHVGIVVHRAIQLIAEDEHIWDKEKIQSKRKWFRQSLKQQGVGEEEMHWASQQVEEALIKMIEDERGQWILSKEHQHAKNEYPLSGVYQGKVISVKLDRTFIDKDGTRWIIDYKTSRHEEEDVEAFLDQQQERYKEQLERYGELYKLYGNEPVKLGLYFPLLQGWREFLFKKHNITG